MRAAREHYRFRNVQGAHTVVNGVLALVSFVLARAVVPRSEDPDFTRVYRATPFRFPIV